MDVNPATPLNSGTLATMGGYWYELPSMSQPTSLVQAPFDAHLPSLTDPDSVTRQTTPAASVGGTPAPPTAVAAPGANVASLAANALYEADAAAQLAQGSGSLATDAAAKFMGAGQQSGLDPNQTAGLAAYEEALKAIPAINGVASSPGLSANTNSAQGKPLTHIGARLAPLVQALKSVSSSFLDIFA